MKKYSVMKSRNTHPKRGKRIILEMIQILNVFIVRNGSMSIKKAREKGTAIVLWERLLIA